MDKYKVIFEWMGQTVTAYKTQEELSLLLMMDGVKLVSVNDSGGVYRRKRRKKVKS